MRDSPVDQSVLLVDNGGLRGTNTPVDHFSPAVPLVVRGGATVIPAPRLTLPGLQVWSASAVVVSNPDLVVQGDALVQAGGSILADGMGEKPGAGTGAGLPGVPAGGGSHGGFGGANSSAQTSGSVISPVTWGSGGGGAGQGYWYGGFGGGSVRLSVTGTLLVDGRISANGTDGQWYSGGGAGGSVNVTAGTLTGSGTISANGGRGDGPSGGGGGGRVAVQLGTNLFVGAVTAFGGAGGAPGGAGTVYWEQTGASNAWLVVNNGGLRRTNTPLSALPAGLHLIVADGAVAHPQTSLPLFRSVTLADGGLLTGWPQLTNLHVATLGDLVLEPGGVLSVSGLGHRANIGPGAGQRLAGQGGGGGHGGTGGASVYGAAGGGRYDSATQPVAWGSGGGSVFPPGTSLVGSAGGGALRLSVAGTLVVNGQLTADGEDAWADDAGGGAGGSVWINANALTGGGLISARGGEAEWFNGGGGGGGRVALYLPVNTFTGLVSVAGGPGAVPGRAGTLFASGMVPELEVLDYWPAGVGTGTVNQVCVTFTDAVDPTSVAAQDFTLLAPDGAVSNLAVSVANPAQICVSFLTRSQPGRYRLLVGPDIAGLVASPMWQVCEGEFEVALPVVAGRVTNVLGQGVAGVTLHPGGALPAATTDAEGRYAIGVPVGWSGQVVPMLASRVFVPGSRAYPNVTYSVTGQDYLVFENSAPTLEAGLSGTNVWLEWFGLPGVSYQVLYSTNLADWYPLGGVLPGTNGPMQWRGTVGELPAAFFRLKAGN